MTLPSDRLQLLFDRHLEFMVKLRTQLLDHQFFAYASEVDVLITEFHAKPENDRSLHESSTNRNSNETAVSQKTPGYPSLPISETCPVVDSNPTIPELAGPNSDALSSHQLDAMSNAHEMVVLTAQKVPDIISSSTRSESHSAIEIFTESNDKDSQACPENLLHASNLEPSAVLVDAVYHSDPQPASDVCNKSNDYISAESNSDLTSNVDPHHPVNLSRFPIECQKHVINRIALIETWVYEDPSLFRGGGGARISQKGEVLYPLVNYEW
ncbi:unnamed protein product [Schistosoma rodhaini]|uniref:Uncharacterized protein n=1 Tax=Schistosoma rodhaini TaxID=6188 RepID=A0AA85GB29_9TREM|nr:unnamed protein product [Schistosoma rodhaini]CAH8627080.1 unnamed protein product [Schistosoma rodhaini]